MILLFSNTGDLTCDFVVRELHRQNAPFRRLNTDEFPTEIAGSATAGGRIAGGARISWLTRNTDLDLEKVAAILYRRPVPPLVHREVTDEVSRQFCSAESYEFLRNLWLSLDCHWISHPDAIRRAEHKLYQLRLAERLSFTIPRTLISNDPREVRTFFHSCSGKMIVKPIYVGHLQRGDEIFYIFTSVVSESDLTEIDSVSHCPSIFQELIAKEFDVRVTVVEDRVFAARIDCELPEGIPDWRYHDLEHLRHSEHRLPPSIETACCELVAGLGLDFGAIDFAVNGDGVHFFLEINPNGQWAWLEAQLGLPISRAIVDRLRSF